MANGASPDDVPLDLLRLGGAAQGFNWLPVFVADEHGILARHGLAVEFQRLGSVEKATEAVRDGLVDLAITPPEGAVADHLAGGDLRILGSNSERLPMSMVARPGIADLAGLAGARIGTSSLTEGTSVYTRLMLEKVGLHYPRDYSFVMAGIHTTRWAALRAGEIDAAPQPAPWSFLAEREGFSLLGEVSDVLPEIVFAAFVVSGPWLEAHRDLAARFMAAMVEAHDLVNDPANDAVTRPIYQRITTPDEPDLAARGLAYTRDLGMWPTGALVSPTAFAATLDGMLGTGLIAPEQVAAAHGVLEPGASR